MSGRPDEFDWIASLRPLTRGDARAGELLDDAAVLPARPGHDLVVSTDAMVEGVHFPVGGDREVFARRLLRTSLSDLAAKAAEPFGYLLTIAWPAETDEAAMAAFRRGLEWDGEIFGVALLGGDTTSTPGPLTASATVFGWAEAGRAVLRSGARVGDALVACGAIGDGWLGLKAMRGEIADASGALAEHYRLPEPLFSLREPLRAHARAAADVSDGLLADAGHIAEASGLAVEVDLDRMPISNAATAWLSTQAGEAQARLALASGGDDYALVCAVAPEEAAAFVAKAEGRGAAARVTGRFLSGSGVRATHDGAAVAIGRAGWRHMLSPRDRNASC